MTGKVIIVTGASVGFGRHIALALARRGHRVFGAIRDVASRNAERVAELERLASNERLPLETIEMNVCDDESVSRAVRDVHRAAGRIDAVVNNAGFGVKGPWETLSIEQAKSQFETNLFGVFRVCKAVVPIMREQRDGLIINVSSDAGSRVTLWESIYAASKFALEAMTEAMRWELQQFGIKACILRPGWYLGTNFGASMITTVNFKDPSGPYQAMLAHMSATRPKVEQGKPGIHEVADKVVELVDMVDPPLRCEVGCLPLRVTPMPDAEYERRLFEFYRLEAFRGPRDK